MRIILMLSLLINIPGNWFVYHAPEPEVEVVICNIKNPKGVFVISFYNDEKSFPKPGREAFTEKVIVKDAMSQTAKFKLPTEGWYAIAMFQDEDESGKIKQDKIGVPLEAFGFSNNIHPKAAAPPFSACKFYVGGDRSSLVIRLIQPLFLRKK